eukprot:jgi/Botrbrau1/15562/Bobra.0274s0006.1
MEDACMVEAGQDEGGARSSPAASNQTQQHLHAQGSITPASGKRGEPQTPCVGSITPEQVSLEQESSTHKDRLAERQTGCTTGTALPTNHPNQELMPLHPNDLIYFKREISAITADMDRLLQQCGLIRKDIAVLNDQSLPQEVLDRLENAKKARIFDVTMKHCGKVLKEVMAHEWAPPFNEPVDTERWSDYLDKVQRPMDFSTIKTNLESGLYQTPEEFDKDMQQVFINAALYNPPETDVFIMAAGVKKDRYVKFPSFVANKMIEAKAAVDAERAAAEKKWHSNLENQKRQRRRELWKPLEPLVASLGQRMQDLKRMAMSTVKSLTVAEMVQLSEDLKQLASKDLTVCMRNSCYG